MNLDSELFEQIVTSLGAGEVTTLPSITLEQRRGPRISAGAETAVRLIPLTDSVAPGPIDVTLRDVSPGGAGFLLNARLPLDEQFVLLLPTQNGSVAILSTVAYWQPMAKNVYAIGVKFNRVLRRGSNEPLETTEMPSRKAV